MNIQKFPRCFLSAPLLAALAVFILQSAPAALYLTEPFNYTAGALGVSPANGTWDVTAKSAINVTATGLTGPAGFPAAAGNDVTIGNTGHNQQNFSTFTSAGTITSGTVYACFLLKVTSSGSMRSADTVTSPNYNDGFTLALQNAVSAASPFCSVRMINSSGIKIGLAKNGGAGTYRSAAITANTTYLVVVKYDFSTTPNTASLWILSTFSGTEAGAGPADVTINTGTDLAPGAAGLGQCYLSDAAGGTFQVDELRIASTWPEATGGAAAGPAAKLAFTTPPANAAPNATLSPVVVQVQAADGTAVASNNVPITLTLSSGTGTLSGTLAQNSDATGKATFSNLSIDTIGAKQLTATASGIGAGLTNAVSSTFNIALASGVKLAFTTQPADTAANTPMANVVVQIQDASGASVASNNVPVTITLTAGTGALSGTTTQNTDSGGKATFGNLSIDTAGTGKQFTAAASGIGTGLTNAVSSAFAITTNTVTSTNAPVITRGVAAANSFLVYGTNSVPGAFVQVLGSPDLTLPVTNWLLVNYQNFDVNGNVIFTNPVSSVLEKTFYRLNTGNNGTKIEPPSISTQPASVIVSPGSTATFTVVAAGPMLQYLWYFNSNAIPAATNASLVIANAQAGNAGNYFVIIANPAGSAKSAVVTLGVGNIAPVITQQPANASVTVGGTALFTVAATGTAPLTYQWYFNTNTLIPVATNTLYTLNGVTTNSAGKYSVIAHNTYGNATSTNATLTVTPAPTNQPDTNVVGYAALWGVTGGAGGAEVFATNYLSFSNYVRQAAALIIHVPDVITGPGPNVDQYCYVYGNNKTIIGDGTNAQLNGVDLRVNATNIIIRNILFQVTPVGTNDGITLDKPNSGTLHPPATGIWIDHCSISNAQDGAIDVTKNADWVTISWCKFFYAPKAGSTHEFVHLIGSSDSDTAAGGVPFKVTLHHNWYGDNCVERMPSVRNGRVHVFNCYYTCAGNNYCVRTRIGSEVLVENSFYLGVQNPWELLTSSGTTGKLKASGNNVTGPGDTSSGNTWVAGWYPNQSLIPGTDTLTDLNPPPYSYTNVMDNVANVPSLLQSYAGSGKYPFAP